MNDTGNDSPLHWRTAAGACAMLIGTLAFSPGWIGTSVRVREALSPGPLVEADRGAATLPGELLDPIPLRTGDESSRRSAEYAQRTREPRSLEDRVEASVRGLARALERAPYDRQGWETRLAATASSLGPSAVACLPEISRRRRSSEAELVAATEILRALTRVAGTTAPPLPTDVLERLRAVAGRTGSFLPTRIAANRSLGAFGRQLDLRGLMERMVEAADPSERSLAGWALGASDREAVLSCLAESLATERSPEELERSFCFLASRCGPPEAGSQDTGVSSLLVERAREALDDTNSGETLRARAVDALTSIASEEARMALIDVLSSKTQDEPIRRKAVAALLSDRNPDAAENAERLWRVADLSDETRLALAEAILRAEATRDPSLQRQPLREAALDCVERSLLNGDDPLRQRRSLHSLEGSPGPRVAAIVDRVLQNRSSTRVRESAAAAQPR